jgi:hypothetical protein
MALLFLTLGCARTTTEIAALPAGAAAGTGRPAPFAPPAPLPEGLSDAVEAVVDRYPTDGSYAYHWPPDDGVWWGTTREVRYVGFLLSPADLEHRSHCVGLTWEVALEVLQAAVGPGQPINGLGLRDMIRFRQDWFVRAAGDPGAAEAVERAGVGVRVPWPELRRGDFLQIWWTGRGGHSAVFDRFETEEGRVVGLRYWSTHPFLGGIGYWTDPVDALAAVYGARLLPPEAWRPVGREPATPG